MIIPYALSTLCLIAAPIVAQSVNTTFIGEFAEELLALNLTSLINITQVINQTSSGQSLLASLGNGSQTIFAPDNYACKNFISLSINSYTMLKLNVGAGVPSNITSNPDLIVDILGYHVVPGTFDTNSSFPNTTVGRTLLNASSGYVYLEGNKNQVLAWSDVNGTLIILNQKCDRSLLNPVFFYLFLF